MTLEMIEFLLEDSKKQIIFIEEYRKEVVRAKKEADANKKDHDYSYWHYLKWDESMPSKSKIKTNLKLIRRLSLDLEKELFES